MSTHLRFPLAKSIFRTLFSSPQGRFYSVAFLILITSCHQKLSSCIHFVALSLSISLPSLNLSVTNLDDLCFSLDDVTDFGNNFFYNDCPGAVNFSELDGKTRRFTLPSVLLSVECSEFEGSSVLEKSLRLLPSDVCAIKSEIGGWRDYPISYSYSVLSSILSSEAVEISELRTWILVNSTRYGVVIDTFMSDHVFLLFRLSMKAVVKEAIVFMRESDANAAGEQSCKSRTFECPVLVRVLSWLASQLGVLYGQGNGKFFALDMLKQFVEVSASRIMLFRSPESSGVLKDLDEDVKIGKALDSGQVISVSRVAAAVAALYERSILEGKMRAIRYAQPLTRYQRMAELGVMTTKADEERKGRPHYRPIIDHDGLPRQRLSNQTNKMKTREELLAEERDYKRRRMSYRGRKVKRTPLQVLRDIIEEFTEEVKLAGNAITLLTHRQDLINNGKEKIVKIAHRVTDHTVAVIEEMMNSQGPNGAATKGSLII
ncbi:unnamed protein product [Brassica oleracea]